MNTHRFLDDDPGRSPRTPRGRLFAAIGAAALALATAPSHARDDANPETGDRKFCSATAALMFSACGFETKSDDLVAQAKCINVADANERTRCLAEAKQARTEAGQLCSAQLSSRRAACTVLGEARYDPVLEASRFDSDFRHLSNPNPYFPLTIGHRWEYRSPDERTTVEIANETKLIEGVTCVVLRDLVYEDDQLVEATDDWFAAGRDGSTWYCGEEAKNYESFEGDQPPRAELIDTDGSFKHGRAGDKAGIIMPAQPGVGQAYQEEFSLGNAEDVSEILSTSYSYGAGTELDRLVPRELAQRLCNRDCVVTKNYALLEPGIVELKYYARGIGFFLETKPDEGTVLQLVNCNFDTRCVALPAP